MSDVVSFVSSFVGGSGKGDTLVYNKGAIKRCIDIGTMGGEVIGFSFSNDGDHRHITETSPVGKEIIDHYKEHHAPKPEMRPMGVHEIFALHRQGALFSWEGQYGSHIIDSFVFSSDGELTIGGEQFPINRVEVYTLDGKEWHKCEVEVK